jgi:hypothetical protein
MDNIRVQNIMILTARTESLSLDTHQVMVCYSRAHYKLVPCVSQPCVHTLVE